MSFKFHGRLNGFSQTYDTVVRKYQDLFANQLSNIRNFLLELDSHSF